MRDVAELTQGQVVEVPVANRLTSPAPLVHVREWARALGSRHRPTQQAVADRITAIGRARRAAAYLTARTGTDPATGKPALARHFDQQALDAEAAADGWYALLTDLAPHQADAEQVLRHHKGQEAVERRYQAFKGPLAVTSLCLESNRRISALITVICLAPLIFCLIERQVRRAPAARGATKVDGLYAGRPAVPTGKLVLNAPAGIRLIPGTGQSPPTIPQPTDLRLHLLDPLDIDPRDLR
ncbi:hypothetical protein [Streptosporangium sp. G12]